MEIQRYNMLKIVLVKKEITGSWLSKQMGNNIFVKRVRSQIRSIYTEPKKSQTLFRISTVSRWMTNKVQPSVEQSYEIARHLDVDVRELLISTI